MAVTAGSELEPSAAVRAALLPLLGDPGAAGIVCDYDGTLSPIVADPDSARPADRAVEALTALGGEFGIVAVLSGRRLEFLRSALSGLSSAVHLAGLYGLERDGPSGARVDPAAAAWSPTVHDAAARLRAGAPSGVLVEDKQLAVTVHWRQAPAAADWAVAAAGAEAERTGLRAQEGKMSVELRPPVAVDKGTAVRDLLAGRSAALYLGDDTGDLPAFAAMARLAVEDDVAAVSGVVVGAETPPDVVAAADLTIRGPAEAVALLRWLAGEAGALGHRGGRSGC